MVSAVVAVDGLTLHTTKPCSLSGALFLCRRFLSLRFFPALQLFQSTLPAITKELGVFAVVLRRSGEITWQQPFRFGEITDQECQHQFYEQRH
jgi:hypothetical protein